ncbi:MAG: porin family protein [Gammaproteobacteria bacterium]|nr:porin family protein [Gammaproteobacteria bacterium]
MAMEKSFAKFSTLCVLPFFLVPLFAHAAAAPIAPKSTLVGGNFFVQAALGPSYSNKSSTQVKITHTETDKLKQTKNEMTPMYNIGIGYAFPLQNSSINRISLILDAYFNADWRSKGYVYQFNMPEPNYRLKMKMRTERLMLDAKVNLLPFQRINPFLLAGVGSSRNILQSYKEIPIPPTTPGYELDFKRHTKNNFAYQLGLGSDIIITKNLNAFAEYLYTDSGYYATGTRIQNQNVPILKGGKFKAREHQVLIGLNYQFC